MHLQERIQKLYDSTTSGWVDVWGDHLHHGYYGPNGDQPIDHQAAQVDMIATLLKWSGVGPSDNIHRVLDVGCGVGGSSRWLANHLSAEVEGITLSQVQRDIAERLSSDIASVRFHIDDANHTSFEDERFDLVWSLESAEHMPCKETFVKECARQLRPGGRLVIATWCHRPIPPPLAESEQRLLKQISRAYQDSLTWVPISTYQELFKDLHFEDIQSDDWSASVTPFWNAVLASVFTLKGIKAIIQGGSTMLKGARGGLSMRRGLSQGLVRYVVITGRKIGHP